MAGGSGGGPGAGGFGAPPPLPPPSPPRMLTPITIAAITAKRTAPPAASVRRDHGRRVSARLSARTVVRVTLRGYGTLDVRPRTNLRRGHYRASRRACATMHACSHFSRMKAAGASQHRSRRISLVQLRAKREARMWRDGPGQGQGETHAAPPAPGAASTADSANRHSEHHGPDAPAHAAVPRLGGHALPAGGKLPTVAAQEEAAGPGPPAEPAIPQETLPPCGEGAWSGNAAGTVPGRAQEALRR